MERPLKRRVSLLFAINGERFELPSVDPTTTLLEFIRTRTRFKGTKLGCGEGGCGACVVLLSKFDPISKQVEDITVSSCLTLLCSIHLCSITTTEGLGNRKHGLHSIHQRISGFHASQCGFCTPGMCMSLFSELVNADKSKRIEPPVGFSRLPLSEAGIAVAGNLCRCTGYRPIVDTCKSFSAGVDLEDLGLNLYWKKGHNDAIVDKLPVYNPESVTTFPEFLKAELEALSRSSLLKPDTENVSVSQLESTDVHIGNSSSTDAYWYYPKSISGLHFVLKDAVDHGKVKVVVGNTASGVYRELGNYNVFIDLKGIPELSLIRKDDRGIEIGSAVTISHAIQVLREEALCQPYESLVFSKIADHMNKVASKFVRNTASIGGNLILAQRHQFASDIATILLAVDSSVTILVDSRRFFLTLEEFLNGNKVYLGAILLSIHIPRWVKNRALQTYFQSCERKILFETYRASPRPLGNAVAYVNAAFLAELSTQETAAVIENLRLAFGAFGTDHAVRARIVEEYIVGKPITASIILEAINLLKSFIQPSEGTTHPRYRSSLAAGYLFYFLWPLAKEFIVAVDETQTNATCQFQSWFTDNSSSHTALLQLPEQSDSCPPLFSSNQVIDFNSDFLPVGQPTMKIGAELQASGEAVYVDDIPSPLNCLHGALIYCTRAMERIKAIKLNAEVASQDVTIISVQDIPIGGMNIGSASVFGEDPLFSDSITLYAGQPLGIVVAPTQKLANMAAAGVLIEYDNEKAEASILSVEDAVEKNSYFEVPSFVEPQPIGNYSEGMKKADHKILSAQIKLPSQYYFYMETQTALAIPDEEDCLVVYSATQCPMAVQDIISKCLGILAHNVRVITRRVGGGFGGKAMRSIPIATACALAAYKLQKPVRMYLDRKTDMILAGGRHPMKINYSVGFKNNGKITALHLNILINAGITKDISPVLPLNIVESLKKYNWEALSFNIKVCKTNLSTKSAMRGPGEVQGSFIAEAIIEHVASVLSIDSDSVRKINMHTFESLKLFHKNNTGEPYEYTLPQIFEKLAVSANLDVRIGAIKHFNSCNRWRKRGISRVPVVVPVTLRPTPGKVGILNDGSVVVEVGGIELGQGLWTKVKQMAAFALGKLCDGGGQDLLPRIRLVQADTLSLIQGGYTAGSTTSESSCEAIRLACTKLVDRLMPVKKKIEEQSGSLLWKDLIHQANIQAVNLSASTYFVPDLSSMSYLNYGAAVTEVEIDLLTGAVQILQTDLIYDCGQSLNPAVDLGQIEGAFVQGIGFFVFEEYTANSDGLVVTEGTWTYKIPTVDTIPRKFNVEILHSGHHQNRVLSSKASGEPPLLLAASVHCAIREAIREARKQLFSQGQCEGSPLVFELPVPATMPVVKELCGFDNVERYLESVVMAGSADC